MQMRVKHRHYTFLLILIMFLSACSSSEGEASPTPEPEAVLTAAAETAIAQMTENANPLPTSTSNPNVAGIAPTATQEVPNSAPVTATISAPQPTPITGGVDQAEFWADVTIPDGTDFNPGEEFTKIWKLRNSGTNTWTPEYEFAFFNGEQMSASEMVPIVGNIQPGETTDVSVDMVAPQASGNYLGYWKMRDPAGEFFEYAVYVQIDVVGGSQAEVTAAPTLSGSGQVKKVSIQVDDPTPEECPHTFTFTGSFTLDEPATVSYRMEAGSDTPGFTYDLPGEFTGTFEAGSHSVTYYLQIQDSVNGWATFHVLSPNDKNSNPTSFSLSCGP
jgi:hypothetical protein